MIYGELYDLAENDNDTRREVYNYFCSINSINNNNNNDELWKAFTKKLSERLSGRCAICGALASTCDADHWRPKGRVIRKCKNSNARGFNCAKKYYCERTMRKPGYNWLAHCWRNAVPLCTECNRENGKLNFFPVRHIYEVEYTDQNQGEECSITIDGKTLKCPFLGHKCAPPSFLNEKELPLLIDPWEKRVSDHIELCFTGYFKNKTEDGACIIAILNLNDQVRVSNRYNYVSNIITHCVKDLTVVLSEMRNSLDENTFTIIINDAKARFENNLNNVGYRQFIGPLIIKKIHDALYCALGKPF